MDSMEFLWENSDEGDKLADQEYDLPREMELLQTKIDSYTLDSMSMSTLII